MPQEPPTLPPVRRRPPPPSPAPPPPRAPAAPRAGADDVAGNRKLIRPTLSRPMARRPVGRTQRRPSAPEQTGLEASHLARLVSLATPVAVQLESGEVLRGVLEWHDRDAVKLRRGTGPGAVVFKHAIVHVTRADESPPTPARR